MGRKNNKTKTNKEQNNTKVKDKLIDKKFVGIIDVNKSGAGFVAVEGFKIDIRISPNAMRTALNGDEVEVKILKVGKTSGRPEGTVLKVLKRNITQFIGIIEVAENFAFVIPTNKNIHTDFFVNSKKLNGAKNGDTVIGGNIIWDDSKKNPSCTILEILTEDKEIEITMKEVLIEEGFPLNFSKEALQEAMACTDDITPYELSVRKDFRNTFTFTIDPTDAKDFDDAISYKELNNNLIELGIHIADVSYYVLPNTTLDTEAYTRATSVYLPDRVNPMLPERISNELCSLRPNEDKFTFSCVFTINKKGKIKDYWIGRTIIHSNRRYTYDEAEEIIEGAQDENANVILQLNELAQLLRTQRMHDGAINFSSEEVRFKLDEKGIPIGIVLKISKKANQLIEEFMLLANKTVAEHVSKILINKKQVPFPYRVHDLPDVDKLGVFINIANTYGYKINTKTGATLASSFNALLQQVADRPEKSVLEALGIRSMAKAAYTTKNIGHYGLAFEHYCHFTSPIRRYPDVLVHRVLQQIIEQDNKLESKMEDWCKHSSEQERKAMKAEREANKYLQVVYMKKHIGDEFEGVVSGVGENGFWVETKEHKCEGMVSARNLLDRDVFKYLPNEVALVGLNSKFKIKMGDAVIIRVAAANTKTKMLDYELIDLINNTPTATVIKAKKQAKKK
jgi:ribonuclease R